jgi:hypothetical protein
MKEPVTIQVNIVVDVVVVNARFVSKIVVDI